MNLPPLREELVVLQGPCTHDGQPSWTLHDPARNRFFRLDWTTFEIVQRWSLSDPILILDGIFAQTPLRPNQQDVDHVFRFLSANQLLKYAGADNSANLARVLTEYKPHFLFWLIHNYLFFRVPLVQPERLLKWLERRLTFLFRPVFWRITLLAALIAGYLIIRQWDVFVSSWERYGSLEGIFEFALVLIVVKLIHELGHGLAATHFGCRVPTMGIAFLVLAPVAYTDTNEMWRLTRRRPRLLIGAAGMLAELCIAAWASLSWAVLPDGSLRSAAFVVATTTWLKSLFINISPVMRFDGYYLLSDYLDLPNLHTRIFALARWKIRQWLFGFKDDPPETFSRNYAAGLISLAFLIWLYRLIVFIGIAVFVYHYFFKVLGIVLFAVEIIWFVVLPVLAEMRIWYERRSEILMNRRWIYWMVALGSVLLLGMVPIPRLIHVQGQLNPKQEYHIVTPESGRLLSLEVRDGSRVGKGQILLRLESDVLEQRAAKASIRVTVLEQAHAAAGVNPSLQQRLPIIQATLDTARAARREVETSIELLTPAAPFKGIFRLSDPELKPGVWLPAQERIGTVFDWREWQVDAYLSEQVSHLIKEGTKAKFYREGMPEVAIDLVVHSIDRDGSRTLAHPMLTTPFGGETPSRLSDGEIIPEQAVYRVSFACIGAFDGNKSQVGRGIVVVFAGSESILAHYFRSIAATLWREAGF